MDQFANNLESEQNYSTNLPHTHIWPTNCCVCLRVSACGAALNLPPSLSFDGGGGGCKGGQKSIIGEAKRAAESEESAARSDASGAITSVRAIGDRRTACCSLAASRERNQLEPIAGWLGDARRDTQASIPITRTHNGSRRAPRAGQEKAAAREPQLSQAEQKLPVARRYCCCRRWSAADEKLFSRRRRIYILPDRNANASKRVPRRCTQAAAASQLAGLTGASDTTVSSSSSSSPASLGSLTLLANAAVLRSLR